MADSALANVPLLALKISPSDTASAQPSEPLSAISPAEEAREATPVLPRHGTERIPSGEERAARVAALDTLRGVAALSVVLFHWTFDWNMAYGYPRDNKPFMSRPAAAGYTGVDLFFMISGFVIILTAEHSRSIRDFAFSRFTRIVPTFLTCILITFAFEKLVRYSWISAPSWGDFFLSLTLLGQYWELLLPSFEFVDGVYWTLSLEITFYAWVGILLATRQLKHIRWYCFGWVALLYMQHFVCTGTGKCPNWVWWRIVVNNLLLVDGYGYLFTAGIAFYLLHRKLAAAPSSSADEETCSSSLWSLQRITQRLITGAKHYWSETVLLLLCFSYGFFIDSAWSYARLAWPHTFWLVPKVFMVIAYLLFAAALLLAVRSTRTTKPVYLLSLLLENRVGSYFGDISYALYLLHDEIGDSILIFFLGANDGEHGDHKATLGPINANIALLVAFAMLLTLATLITFYIERPLMRLLRSWYKSRTAGVCKATPAPVV